MEPFFPLLRIIQRVQSKFRHVLVEKEIYLGTAGVKGYWPQLGEFFDWNGLDVRVDLCAALSIATALQINVLTSIGVW